MLGEFDSENGLYVVEILCQVCQVNMDGDFDVVVIGFVYKGIINKVGVLFSGYIEFFVYQFNIIDVVMFLVIEGFNVVFVIMYIFFEYVVKVII